MPLYEYTCEDCGNEFEKFMRFDQAHEHPACPACGGTQTDRKISLVSSKGFSFGTSSASSCGPSSGGFT